MRATMQEQRRAPVVLRVVAGLLITVTSMIGVLFFLAVILAKVIQRKEWRDRIRRFNKRTLNPATLNLAGKRLPIYGAIHHVGRRSGHEYVTPIVVRPLGDGFVIPLPYGPDVDWCRNVMASGTCVLDWESHTYELERPEIISATEALKAYPLLQRLIFQYGGISQYLWLHQQGEAPEKVVAPGS